MSGADIGIDLGTANVLIYVSEKGIVLEEPSVVAVDNKLNKIIAVGTEARKMIGRTPANIDVIRPLRDGVISNYEITEEMLSRFIEKIVEKKGFGRFVMPRIMVCVPTGVTEVEKRAVVPPPNGNMVIDIGGGTTDIAVISLGGSVVSDSIKLGGDKFDEAIIKYIKKEYNVLIGERSAEKLKIEIGTAVKEDEPRTMNISGRNLVKGLPVTISVSSTEILEALDSCIEQIVIATKNLLEKTPPELAADISDKGIIMTGGGAMLRDLDKRVEQSTGIKVTLAHDPLSCVAKGTGLSLSSLDLLETGGNFKK